LISAKTGDGFEALRAELGSRLRPVRELVDLAVPHHESLVAARLHAVGQVLEADYEGPEARFKARIPPHVHSEFAPYIVKRSP